MALLLAAMRSRNPDDIKKALIENEIDINEPFKTNGQTPLFFAMQMNLGEDIMSLLLEKGADVNKPGDVGLSPLHYAVKYHRKYAKFLIDKGANVNAVDSFLETPLHYAVTDLVSTDSYDDYNYEIVALLVEKGADVHYKNIEGNSPLDFAEGADLPELIDILDPPSDIIPKIPFITIPKGTLLFNAYTVPVEKVGIERTLSVFEGVLPYNTQVVEEGDHYVIRGSVDRFHQKFFYSTPIGTGGMIQSKITGYVDTDTGKLVYPVINIFETRRDLKVALLMSPGPYHRTQNANTRRSPVITCDKTSLDDCLIHEDGQCKYGYRYDACISARVLQEQTLDGHVAIAGMDSYEQVTDGKHSDRIMKTFVPDFNHHTGWDYYKLVNKLLAGGLTVDTIKDKTYNIGFPELVLHPFGTDWYADSKTRNFEIKVDGPREVSSIVKKLLQINESDYSGLGITNSLQLVYTITRDGSWAYLRRLVQPYAVFNIPGDRGNFSLLSILFNNFNELSAKFNAQTGFLEHGDGFDDSLKARLRNKDENRLIQSGLEFNDKSHKSRTYKKKRRARKTRK